MTGRWELTSAIPPLAATGVQVWRLDLRAGNPPAWLAAGRDALSPDERVRAAKIRAAGVQREFLSARTLLRTLLGAAVACKPSAVAFELGASGKPQLRGNSGIEFNVSHSHGLILIALSRASAVGVDVEIPHGRSAFEPGELVEIAQENFPAAVAREIAEVPAGPARVQAFYRAWTIREAVAKADGRGIASPLSYQVFGSDESGEYRVALELNHGPIEPLDFFVRREDAGAGSIAALATPQPRAAVARFDAAELRLSL